MKDFGFSPMKNKVLNFDELNHDFHQWIAIQDSSFNLCIACGTCASTCSAGSYTHFSFRELCKDIRWGNAEKAMKESEKCMLCGKCSIACPRNINTRNIIKMVRKAAKTSPL
ncbi:MAG: 4Fe-4S binding protein [Bacteroidales bacterium]|jgi:heterodisulfide reductase subunit C|nr:4Fe-4S binding protein [Bacteroidales bacterium]